MSNYEYVGGLGELGILPNPIGTLQEIQAAGLPADRVPCCAPPGVAVMPDGSVVQGSNPRVRGCAHWHECPFHLKKFNHGVWTKGEGPRNVGYRLITHEGDKAENDMPCFNFVRTLLRRMRAGEMAIAEGRVGERIRIVAQEGLGTIRVRVQEKVNPQDTSRNPAWKFTNESRPVHKFPRPSEVSSTDYDALILNDERKAQRREQEMDEAFASPEPMEYDENDNKDNDVGLSDLPAPSGAAPIAAPVEKGKK